MKFLVICLFTALLAGPTHAVVNQGQLTFLQGQWIAHWSWVVPPKADAAAILKIEWRSALSPVAVNPPGPFKVDILMPDPAMTGMMYPSVNDPLPLIGEGHILPGIFQVSPLYFSMSGTWQVNVHLSTGDGTETQSWSEDVQ